MDRTLQMLLRESRIKLLKSKEDPHYSVSIIRDRGIDRNAINYILNKHRAECIQFVDGWIGKGAIFRELKKELEAFEGIQDSLACRH